MLLLLVESSQVRSTLSLCTVALPSSRMSLLAWLDPLEKSKLKENCGGSDESTCTELLSVFWASKGRRKEVEMRRRSFALLLLFAAEAMIA
jgi:hypothetical protein